MHRKFSSQIQLSFLILSLFQVHSASASTSLLDTRIDTVMAPDSAGEEYRLFSTVDGRVYDVSAAAPGAVERVKSLIPGEAVRLTIEDDRVVGVESLSDDDAVFETLSRGFETFDLLPSNDLGYAPTELASSSVDTQALFNGLEILNRKSQCYQRAHMWAYSMWNQRSIKSMKVFLFFTRRFIREYRFKWWFHVAPFIRLDGKETVLDRTFAKGPLEMKAWTDVFMLNDALCPEIARYTDYSAHQDEQYCYLLKLPMYYYQPKDGEALDLRGETVPAWREWEIKHSEGARKSSWWPF